MFSLNVIKQLIATPSPFAGTDEEPTCITLLPSINDNTLIPAGENRLSAAMPLQQSTRIKTTLK